MSSAHARLHRTLDEIARGAIANGVLDVNTPRLLGLAVPEMGNRDCG